jgi:hypoxanthine phosphoribosyltransferase
VLFEERTILARLDELGRAITQDYRGRELTVVAILHGSIVFMADLLRRIHLPLRIESINVASYHGGTSSSGAVEFNQLRLPDLRGQHVVVLDDILDSGRTLKVIKERLLEECQPLSVRSCVLLSKTRERATEVNAEYVGFDVDDCFVVGYGLDYKGRYRNLPLVGTLRKEVIEAETEHRCHER